MTARIRDFLRNRTDDGPCLVVDLDVVRDNYQTFAKALPDTRVFYAVKANPAPEVLSLLASLGSCFDTASVAEIEMVLAAGATADRISFGNTIKKERDVARAYALGIRLFAVDCQAEVEKIARAAPGAPRVLPHPLRLHRGGVAALAQVRVRARDGGRRAGACAQARPRALWRVVPRRFAAAQPACLGPCARLGGRGVPGVRRSRHEPVDGQPRRRLPDQVPEERADGEDLRQRHLQGAAQAFRQPHPGDDHRAGPRHGRQCRR